MVERVAKGVTDRHRDRQLFRLAPASKPESSNIEQKDAKYWSSERMQIWLEKGLNQARACKKSRICLIH
ncbi:MAG: hypothetical protein KC444_09935 [Nitrosopumilus sp.]|nr:hypothetical protein [Nitrosopumilus sp.]